MNGAIRWMARNHVAANLLMLVFIVGGVLLGFGIKQEVFPEISLDMIQVSVAYPGAGPEEVEEGVLLKIEENLIGVDGIKQIRSVASEGFGTVTAELDTDADPDRVLADIKSEVDRITTFPEDAEEPVISKLLNRHEVISVVVYGDVSERALREQAERVRDDLLEYPQITQVDLAGVRPYQITIEIPEQRLRQYGLTLDAVADRIRRASLDLPGGTVKTAGGDILIRTKERRYFGPGYRDIVIRTLPDGTQVRLGDLARVIDGFAETDLAARFDGKPAAMVKVSRVGRQKPIEISRIVRDYVEKRRAELPTSIRIAAWNDTSELFKSRRDLLVKNARIGLVLVFLVLGLFLEIRLAFWVMLGIPISFCGALLFMPGMDVSINMISMFAFIMALGIVVDDAIVVGENVYDHRQMDKPYPQAAEDGAIEVGRAVVFAVLTTIAAFAPLLFTGGMLGKFIGVIPKVVIVILLVSLVESLFVLPAHLALGKRRPLGKGLLGRIDRVRRWFGRQLERFISGPYRRVLAWCLRYRYVTLAGSIAVLLLTVGTFFGGILKFHFMPEVDGDLITVDLELPPGTPYAQTEKVVRRVLDAGNRAVAEFDAGLPEGKSVLRHVYAVIGGRISGTHGPGPDDAQTASNIANIVMLLTKSENRDVPATAISDRWRELTGEIPGVETLTFASNLVRMGANIDIQIAHEDFAVLEMAAGRVKAALAGYPGVTDIADNYAVGKRELKIRLSDEGRTLGLTELDLGRQLRAAYYGTEALRLQRGRNEVKVLVRYPEQERQFLWNLEQLRVRTPDGGEVPLLRAADVVEGRGYAQINRSDRKRVINVTARVDSSKASADEILRELKAGLLADLARDYPGIGFDFEGEQKEQAESMDSMKTGFLLALFAIFALLAVPLRSYSQPLLIMSAIPFGIVGALLGHLIMGFSLSILSLFGIVALAGVVVNDSLLLIDYANGLRRSGLELTPTLLQAGQRRFRPIMLTSLTTFFGLMPMILETSVQAQFLIPMAISLGFGIMFATGITLLLIPSLYLILEDIRRLFGFKESHADHPGLPAVETEPR
ncbi:multidrug efflux pump subunit AcrB [Geothermobacter ehrlichii]|uniref:Multidrug efflux pump subunit AcrB n=1 Tax=Geothermobacter ehrlichii TaxID=213224 RepID=A0A5D3WNB5_9BACT|nr:efflux RND transporter permease subunit [Geothermobacter ehrlichii]TYO99090.1 multidrug efflux pump subunit AcrB [Geothermobacter ehrlichii]